MAALVTLQEAKRHLRVDHADDDYDIERKAESASDIVVDYIKRPDHGWTVDSVPSLVRAAILLVLGDLYEQREESASGDLLKDDGPVARLLWRYRDPALA